MRPDSLLHNPIKTYGDLSSRVPMHGLVNLERLWSWRKAHAEIEHGENDKIPELAANIVSHNRNSIGQD